MNIKMSAKHRGHITEEAEPHLFEDKRIPDPLDIQILFESKQPILLLSMEPMETESPDRPRTRAKKACLSCNSRRVRCNVLEMQPCQNCVSWNLTCEVGVSRRGK